MRISLLLNLVLLGCLCLPWIERRHPVATPPPPAREPAMAKVAEVIVAPTAEPKSMPIQPPTFRWNQLYDRDYCIYVKNLRAIGCPAHTVRAIVAADVASVIQEEADALNKKLADFHNCSWSSQLAGWTNENHWQAQIQHLPEVQAAMIADCLGEVRPAALASKVPPAAAGNETDPFVAPLIEQPVDVTALNLDPGQLQAISDLRELFRQKVRSGADANDPEYRLRWQAAQVESDDLLKGMIGEEAYEAYQSQALANVLSTSDHAQEMP